MDKVNLRQGQTVVEELRRLMLSFKRNEGSFKLVTNLTKDKVKQCQEQGVSTFEQGADSAKIGMDLTPGKVQL